MRMPALAALGLCAALVTPASATGVQGGVYAQITPDETGGACLTVSANGTFAGEFSAAGLVTAIIQDGVVVISPIQGAVPLVGTDNATACIPGVWGAHSVRGDVVFTVAVADQTREFAAEVLVCTYGEGSPLPCV